MTPSRFAAAALLVALAFACQSPATVDAGMGPDAGTGTDAGTSAADGGGSIDGGLDSGTADGGTGAIPDRQIGAFVYVERKADAGDAVFAPLTAWAQEYGVSPALWHGFYCWKHVMVDDGGQPITPDGLSPIDTRFTSYWMYDDDRAWSPDGGFGPPGSGQGLGAKRFVDFVYAHFDGGLPLITFRAAACDPVYQVENFSSWQPEFTLDQINAGAHDAYLAAFAQQVAKDGRPMQFRIFHECNGVNYPYTYANPFQAQNAAWVAQNGPFPYGLPDAGFTNGDRSTNPNLYTDAGALLAYGELAQAYRRVVQIFRANGATNVEWVWNVGSSSTFTPPPAPDGGRMTVPPPLPAPDVWTHFYPGDDVVDYAAMDGYNKVGSGDAGWRTAEQIFQNAYDAIASMTTKPLQISEVACDEDATDAGRKAQWLLDAYGASIGDAGPGSFPERFPRIRQIVGFDHTSRGDRYQFDSSPESKAAWQSVLSSGLYEVLPYP